MYTYESIKITRNIVYNFIHYRCHYTTCYGVNNPTLGGRVLPILGPLLKLLMYS